MNAIETAKTKAGETAPAPAGETATAAGAGRLNDYFLDVMRHHLFLFNEAAGVTTELARQSTDEVCSAWDDTRAAIMARVKRELEEIPTGIEEKDLWRAMTEIYFRGILDFKTEACLAGIATIDELERFLDFPHDAETGEPEGTARALTPAPAADADARPTAPAIDAPATEPGAALAGEEPRGRRAVLVRPALYRYEPEEGARGVTISEALQEVKNQMGKRCPGVDEMKRWFDSNSGGRKAHEIGHAPGRGGRPPAMYEVAYLVDYTAGVLADRGYYLTDGERKEMARALSAIARPPKAPAPLPAKV